MGRCMGKVTAFCKKKGLKVPLGSLPEHQELTEIAIHGLEQQNLGKKQST